MLWAFQGGLAIAWVPLIWAAASLVKALVSIPAGIAADRWGRLQVVRLGWSLRVVLLLALALIPAGGLTTWGLFLVYAAALAMTEGAERALIGDLAPADQKGTLFGLYHLLSGLLVLPGAVLLGLLWERIGMESAFAAAAGLTALAAGYLLREVEQR